MSTIPDHYYARLAEVESGNDPFAQNPNSSAKGLYQFIDSTGRQYGLHQYQFGTAAYTQAEKRAVRQLTQTNFNGLRGTLGRDPTPGELYLAHQQGLGGARKLLGNPNANAAATVGSKAVTLNGGNTGMSNQQFANLWIQKFEKGLDPSKVESSFGGPVGDDTAFGDNNYYKTTPSSSPGGSATPQEPKQEDPENEARDQLEEELDEEEDKTEEEQEEEEAQEQEDKEDAEDRYLDAKAKVDRLKEELKEAETDEEKQKIQEELEAAEKELEAAKKDYEEKGGVVEDDEEVEDDYQSRWIKDNEEGTDEENDHKNEEDLVSDIAGEKGLNAAKLLKILIEKAPLSEDQLAKLKLLMATLSEDNTSASEPVYQDYDMQPSIFEQAADDYADYKRSTHKEMKFDHFVAKKVGHLLPDLENKINDHIETSYPDLGKENSQHLFTKIVEKKYPHIFDQVKMYFEDMHGSYGGDGGMPHDYRPDMGDVFESHKDHLDHLLQKHGYTKPEGHRGGQQAHQHDDVMDVYEAPELDISVNQQDIV